MKSLFKFLILAFLSISLQAQEITQTIRGTITEAATQQPIPGAAVILFGSNPIKGTMTDLDGNFRLENVAVGRPIVQVSMVGYAPVKLSNLVLTSSKELILNIVLEATFVQGLFENAVKHNIISKDKKLKIHIGVNDSCIFVENNLQIKDSLVSSNGIGLENIQSRYLLSTNKDIQIIKTSDKFRVELPIITL